MTGTDTQILEDAKSKVLPLKEAIGRYVKPGMKLHIAGGMGGPGAAVCEIIRQYHGKKPGFELIQSTVAGHSINLLHCNLVLKMVFAACVDISPAGRPSRVMQENWASGTVQFENWSLCALQERLMAGALGIPFMPTRSISGSSMARDNKEAFCEIDNPFDGGICAGLVKALNPDISIVHGCVADPEGNTVLGIPYGEDIWGPLASTQGVLVTVEKIVSADVIRKHAALVKIPGYLVNSVSVVPAGVHPFALANPGIEGFAGYESDVAFLQDLHAASLDDRKLDDWIEEWVLGCADHGCYLRKLGSRKTAEVPQTRAATATSDQRASARRPAMSAAKFTAEEMMLIAASREIIKSVLRFHHRLILLGAGSRSMSVLLAYYQLNATGYDLQVISGNGQYGYDPKPGELALQSLSGVYSARMMTDTITAQGVLIGGKDNRCLGILGAGQIDEYGNTNSTLTSSGQFLVGSGGANDVANAREVMVILNQARDRFRERLPYVTSPGDNVSIVVSTMGVFSKPVGKNGLNLVGCLPDPEMPALQDRLKRIQKECEWPLKIATEVEDMLPPTAEELKLLRRF